MLSYFYCSFFLFVFVLNEIITNLNSLFIFFYSTYFFLHSFLVETENPITALCFSQNGLVLIAGDIKGCIHLWNMNDAEVEVEGEFDEIEPSSYPEVDSNQSTLTVTSKSKRMKR